MNDRAKAGRGARSAAAGTTLPKSVCERLPIGFAHFDASFRLAVWNARFAPLRGYPRKLLKAGTPLEAFVRFDAERGEYREGAIDALTRTKLAALKRGRPAKREQALPDGSCVRIACERVPEGGLLLICEDVTEAHSAAQRLRESEERYDFAMRAINEGVYDWDLASDAVHYSDRAWQAVGLSPEDDFTARRYFARIHPDDQPKYRAATLAHFRGETERFECDYRYRVRDGSWRWARQHGIALRDATGRAVRLIGSTGDITELKERERQLAEQTAEQTAVRELLEAISRSAFDLDAVLRTLIEKATRLCRADKGFIFRREGDVYRLAFDYGGVAQAFRDFVAQHEIRAGRDTLVGRTALTKAIVHIEDVLVDPEYRWRQSQQLGGHRSMLGVPIVREDEVIGVIAMWKERVEPFTPAQIGLVATFSSQAAIAIQNASLFSETKEALEQQTATAEILRVISESPGDLDPVFRAILERATTLCDAQLGIVFRWDGERYHVVATRGEDADAIARWKEAFAAMGRPGPHSGLGRLLVDKQPVHIPDILEEVAYREGDALRLQTASILKARSFVAVPLLKNDAVIGAVVIYRHEVRPFSARQVELVKVFADQAVIAIENVRLFNETKEALEQQTATAEILRVISSSPTDLAPVFDAVARRAARLCDAPDVVIVQAEGESMRFAASVGPFGQTFGPGFTIPITRGSVAGRAVLERRTIQVHDLAAESAEEYPVGKDLQRRHGHRTMVAAPLLLGETALGAIVMLRTEVRPYSEKQLALLRTFADQAVIAIGNARLFNELQLRNRELTESLEQQTATAEILKVISSSPTDVQPVFDAIVRSGVHLFQGVAVTLRLVKGERIERAAFAAGPDCKVTDDFTKPSFPLDERNFSGRAVLRQEVIHARDIFAEDWVGNEARKVAERMGWRAIAAAPMLREGKALGAILVVRAEAAPFSEKEIALLRTFADQAVIAIENVRLFNELQARNRELTGALDREKATGEILRVISGSPTDIQPVLDAVAERAGQLCDSPHTNVLLAEGDNLKVMSVYSTEPGPKPDRGNFVPISRTYVNGRAVLDREVIHIPDVLPLLDTEFPDIRRNQRKFGFRAVLVVPLMREGRAVGTIFIWRREPGLFSDDQVGLLKTFADQAVIAIENVRLFNELEVRNRDLTESLEQQTATAEILRVISNSPTDITPVLDAVAESATRLCEANDVVVMMNDGNVLRAVKSTGPFGERFGAEFSIPITRGSAAGRAVIERTTVQVPDFELESDEEYPVGREHQRIYGNHGAMATPLLRGDAVLGVIAVLRRDARPFSERQSALLQTFADQAAIAIANVRLFNETKEALERQTATAEILRVIASSPADEQPVFDAIVAHAGRIAGGCSVNVSRLVGDKLHLAAYTKISPEADDLLKNFYPISATEARPLAEAVRRKTPFFVSDFETDPDVSRMAREVMRARGFRSTLYVPIRRQDLVYGVMHVSKVEPGAFPDHWVNMLKIFADQAVIAIENVRLFNETKEALDHQRASAEILQVISSSVADTKPVFEKILESCERLFAGRNVGINLVGEDGALRLGAYHGPNSAELERQYPVPLGDAGSGLAILERRVVHYPDVEAPGLPEFARRGSRIAGNRSALFAPMLWEGRGIGAIFVGRGAVGEFSEKEIALLKTFADQAVIAIQNARLFHEIQEKSHQLEIANQHKSAFLANMSHELRTPLNAVIGFSEMLAARYFGDLTAKQAEYVNDIHGSGKHLLSLINDILDLSKIEAGRMELELGEFDLRAALDNALTLVRERAQRGGVALRFDADAALGSFRGDERKLKQVMLNLLSNAVKFTPRGGAVDVLARRADGAVEVAVRDTGAGIAPEDQEAIFEAFRQVGTDVTRKREGTGLGLALTRRFVELHGGTIRVESALGKGSTFTVQLPIRHGE